MRCNKKTFNKEGLVEGEHFNVTMLEDNEEALESMKNAGYLQAPIVFVKTKSIETDKAVIEEENYSEENIPEEDTLEEKICNGMDWLSPRSDKGSRCINYGKCWHRSPSVKLSSY